MVEAEVGGKTLKSIHGHGGAAPGRRDLQATGLHRAGCTTPISAQRRQRQKLEKRYDPNRRRNLRRGQISAHGRDVREQRVEGLDLRRFSGKQGVESHGSLDPGCLCVFRKKLKYGVGL